MKSFYSLTPEELNKELVDLGYSKYSSSQVYDWVYRKKIKDFSLMSNVKKELREYLINNYDLYLPSIVKKEVSKDNTAKYLLEMKDKAKIETVLMYHDYGPSLCVTSEVGCNMGCAFCASGLLKKERELEASEMVSQILLVEEDQNIKISHIVIMGTGEPLDNLDNVIKFIKIINASIGLEIGIRHITLSTCGIVPKIYELADLNLGINLAISLHAPTDDLREKIMPIARAYKLKELIESVEYYFNKTKRRITFEYLLLDGVNDSRLYADKLADLIKGLNAYVNLIPYNEVREFSFKTAKDENVNVFYNQLKQRGINVTKRRKMGDDINAACGQLRSINKKGAK